MEQGVKAKRIYKKLCDICGEKKADTAVCNNPFTEEIYGEKVKQRLCGECFQDLLDDI